MNLEAAYPHWRLALGLGWREYLEKVEKVSGTGIWVNEVVADILASG